MRGALILYCALLVAASCLVQQPAEREAASAAGAPSQVGQALVLGDFPLAPRAVVDGDTLRVNGLETPIRLVGIDTEEVFYSRIEREQATDDFVAYAAAKRGRARATLPRKYATPMGETAKAWITDRLQGHARVRLEIDRGDRTEGFFDRKLVHVFVREGGRDVHLNSEIVRAGLSPYFTKYGRARRFHTEFLAAQREARAAGRGIWSSQTQHYDDYDERLAWWQSRADQVDAFDRKFANDPRSIALLDDDAWLRIRDLAGQRVLLFGEIRDLWSRSPMRVEHRSGRALEIRCPADSPARTTARTTHGQFAILDAEIESQHGTLSIRCRNLHIR